MRNAIFLLTLGVLVFSCQKENREVKITVNGINMDSSNEYNLFLGDERSDAMATFKFDEQDSTFDYKLEISEITNVALRIAGPSFMYLSTIMEPGQELIIDLMTTEEGEIERAYQGSAGSVALVMDEMNQIDRDFREAQRERAMSESSESWDDHLSKITYRDKLKKELIDNLEKVSDDVRYVLEAEAWSSMAMGLLRFQMMENRQLDEGEEEVTYPEVEGVLKDLYTFDERAFYSEQFNFIVGIAFNEVGRKNFDAEVTYGTLHLSGESDRIMYDAVMADNTIPSLFKERGLALVLERNSSYPPAPLSAALALKDKFLEDFPESSHAEAVKADYAKWEKLRKGTPAPDFTLEDPNGEMVSLSDFKGSVVYIDVWATWCGPCIKEFSYAEEIKELFSDAKDVTFMYVSVDKPEKKDKWKKDLVKHGLAEGVNLFANGPESTFTDLYNRTGIPRYILIDKEGLIHDAKTYRPSSKEVLYDEIQKLRGVKLERALSMR